MLPELHLGVGLATDLITAYDGDMNNLISESIPKTPIYLGYYVNGTSENHTPISFGDSFIHAAFVSFNCGNGSGIQFALPHNFTANVACRIKWSGDWSSWKIIGGA